MACWPYHLFHWDLLLAARRLASWKSKSFRILLSQPVASYSRRFRKNAPPVILLFYPQEELQILAHISDRQKGDTCILFVLSYTRIQFNLPPAIMRHLHVIKLTLLQITITLASFHQSPPHHPDLHHVLVPVETYQRNRILILPGFGNSQQDYTNTNSLVPSLLEHGWSKEHIRVLPITTFDWLQVFLLGMGDVRFWKGNAAPTRPAFRWYLDLIADEIHKWRLEDDNIKVVLIGHSAGGWLARAAVGFLSGEVESIRKTIDLKHISGIVTLGSPHLPPPSNVCDISRGALR